MWVGVCWQGSQEHAFLTSLSVVTMACKKNWPPVGFPAAQCSGSNEACLLCFLPPFYKNGKSPANAGNRSAIPGGDRPSKPLSWGQQDGSLGKDACCQASWPEFDSWDLHGERREQIFARFPLIFIYTMVQTQLSVQVHAHMHICTHEHTYTKEISTS